MESLIVVLLAFSAGVLTGGCLWQEHLLRTGQLAKDLFLRQHWRDVINGMAADVDLARLRAERLGLDPEELFGPADDEIDEAA